MPRLGPIGRTVLSRGDVTFEWEIRHFFSLSDKPGDSYDSSSFSFIDTRWLLSLYPNDARSISQGKVGLYLRRGDSGPPKTVNYTLGIKSSGGVVGKNDYKYKFSEKDEAAGNPDFLSRSDLKIRQSILMRNDVLTLTCVLKSDESIAVKDTPTSIDQAVQVAVVGTPPESTDQAVQAVPVGEERVLKSLLGMLESGDDSDVVIKVGEKEFPAHRIILRASPAVSGSMFARETAEKDSGVVHIKDSDPGTFPELLVYTYSGSCVLSAGNARSLYEMADRCDVGDLKEACSEFLQRNVAVECFCDVIALAAKHNDTDLAECATRFFCDNAVDVVKTAAWQTFMVENPTVANELFLKAASKLTAQ